MNILIIILRFPIAIIVSVLSTLFLLAIFPFETLLVLIIAIAKSLFFPIAIIFTSRSELQDYWESDYPASLKAIPEVLEEIWNWVFND